MTAFSGESGEAPRIVTHRVRHNTDAAAGTDYSEVLCTAPFAGTITGAVFLPDAAKSGDTTTATTWTIANKTQTLNAAALAFITGVDLVAFTSKAITVSGTGSNLVVALGDVIALVKTHASTGLAMPSGVVEVTFSRNDIL